LTCSSTTLLYGGNDPFSLGEKVAGEARRMREKA
jgi:hypothetical protein